MRGLTMLALLLLPILGLLPPHAVGDEVVVLSYHDVRGDVDGNLDRDATAVHRDNLAEHFAWLRAQGYQPVSLQALRDARAGKASLPEKAVLLTFDDGYASFYHEVFPLLKLYGYPAVFALVTSWLEVPAGGQVRFGDDLWPRDAFVTWQQVREIQASGLVEIASHSHDQHHGIVANPQGNRRAAITTRRYDPESGNYEAEDRYERRIRDDLRRSQELIYQRTGVSPTAIVWPYGEHNASAWRIARELGFDMSLILGGDPETRAGDEHLARHLILGDPNRARFAQHFREPSWRRPIRVVHVDLDYVYDPDPEQQRRNIDVLVQRIYDFRISTVYLQAFADPDGDGRVQSVYFPNRHLPMRADLFSHVAWQLRTRAGVEVFAWMPVSAFIPAEPHAGWLVQRQGVSGPEPSDSHYQRLSIFDERAERWIDELYRDLARYTFFDGLLFHDDGLFTDHEDMHPAALEYYREQGFSDFDLESVRQDPAAHKRWAQLKEQALIDFSLRRAATVREERTLIKTARNLFALPVLQPESKLWFAQSLESFSRAYDQTAIMAMPKMEGARNPGRWLRDLARAARAADTGSGAVVFELQARDWRDGSAVDAATLSQQMRLLQREGVVDFGYYPDDFIRGKPDIDILRPVFSLEDYPWKRP